MTSRVSLERREASQRQKANERPITGPYPELAREVRRLLGYDPKGGRPLLVSRKAAEITGVNHATITTTLRGDRPSEESIIKLASSLGGDAPLLLKLGGYYVTEERRALLLMSQYADPKRFDIGPEFQGYLDPSGGPYFIFTMEMWHTYGPRSIQLIPLTESGYPNKVVESFLAALEEGDPETRDVDDLQRELLLECALYAQQYVALQRNVPTEVMPTEVMRRLERASEQLAKRQERIGVISRRNDLALVGWYERRNEEGDRLPPPSDLLRMLTEGMARPGKHQIVPAGFARADWMVVVELARLMTLLLSSGEAGDEELYAAMRLSEALRYDDPPVRLLSLIYTGLYVMARWEIAKLGSLFHPELPNAPPASAPYAYCAGRALMDWWADTELNPQQTLDLSFEN